MSIYGTINKLLPEYSVVIETHSLLTNDLLARLQSYQKLLRPCTYT